MRKHSRILMTIVLFVTITFLTVAAQAQSFVYVDASSNNTTAPSTQNPGDSWSGAYRFLQSGLTRADQ